VTPNKDLTTVSSATRYEASTLDLSSEAANGNWRLRVEDSSWSDTGYLDSWTLNL
jgi:subtilisin-like proprotein convertase family protein